MREVAIIQMQNRHGMVSEFQFQTPKEKGASNRREYDEIMKNKQHYLDMIAKAKKALGK